MLGSPCNPCCCPPECAAEDIVEEFEGTFILHQRWNGVGPPPTECGEADFPFPLDAVFTPFGDGWRALFAFDFGAGSETLIDALITIVCGRMQITTVPPHAVYDPHNPIGDALATWPPFSPIGEEPFVFGFCEDDPGPTGQLPPGDAPFCRPPPGTYTFYRYNLSEGSYVDPADPFGPTIDYGPCEWKDCIWTLVIHE